MDNEKRPIEAEEKLEAGELSANSRVLKWLDNFWYHYKWHTIIITFFVAVFTVGLVQLLTRPAYDTMIVCAGGVMLTEEEIEELNRLMVKRCPEDFNKDGEILINFVNYQAYSNEELQKEKEAAEARGEQVILNGSYYAKEHDNFIFFTQTGEGAVCIVSPYLYENLSIEERLRAIPAMYEAGELPTGVTADGNGVVLGQTDLYTYSPAIQALPQNWIICLLKPTLNADEEDYARSEQFFRALIEYRVENS